MKKASVIGEYGSWADSLNGGQLGELSFRRDEFTSVATWRQKARAKTLELLSMPPDSATPKARVEERLSLDGLDVERLSWRLPYGQCTEAVFLKPAGARGKLPAMLALHDHGGFKYFGYSKIADDSANVHPLVVEHRADAYAGLAWPNELARRGWAVLCHDAFAFGSRRVRYENVIDELVRGREEPVDDDADSIRAYNEWA